MTPRQTEILDRLLELLPILAEIKHRCHNVTPDEMQVISEAVKLYNEFTGKTTLRASACSLPSSLGTIRKLLAGHGRIQLEKWERFRQ